MMKRFVAVLLILGLVLSLAACGGDTGPVSVQRADQLKEAGQAGDRYTGMVVSEHVAEIQKDSTKSVLELYVKVGQEVKTGDKLFSYDSAALELDLEKLNLEIEKMENEQKTYASQQKKLEKQLKNARTESQKVQLTLEINTLKTNQLENDYNIQAKKFDAEKLQNMIANIDILSPVDGTVRKIDEKGEDGGPYITIQQSGAYRVQGTINEMDMGGSLMPGARVRICSRVSDATWMGTVDYIDTEETVQDNNNMYYGDTGSSMNTSSNYHFYVAVDDVTGLLLGQHVYMEVVSGDEAAMGALWLPEGFLTGLAMNEETYETTGNVFAEGADGKLTQVTVVLGMYDYMTGCYEVLSGITGADYLADPLAPGCEAGAAVVRREAEDFSGPAPVATEPAETEAAAAEDTAGTGEIIETLPAEETMAVEELAAETEG